METTQTVTVRVDGREATWRRVDFETGEWSGDERIGYLVDSRIAIDDLEGTIRRWLPYGYPATGHCAHTVYLAAREEWPGAEVAAQPPLEWPDEVIG